MNGTTEELSPPIIAGREAAPEPPVVKRVLARETATQTTGVEPMLPPTSRSVRPSQPPNRSSLAAVNEMIDEMKQRSSPIEATIVLSVADTTTLREHRVEPRLSLDTSDRRRQVVGKPLLCGATP